MNIYNLALTKQVNSKYSRQQRVRQEMVQYEKLLENQYPTTENQQDLSIILHILEQENRSKLEVQYLERVFQNYKFFEDMKEFLSKSLYMSLFRSVKLKRCQQFETVMNKGDYGQNYFIVLRGEVVVLLQGKMTDQEQKNFAYKKERVDASVSILQQAIQPMIGKISRQIMKNLSKRLLNTQKARLQSEKIRKLISNDKKKKERFEPLTTENMLKMDGITVRQKIQLKHPGFKIVHKISRGEGFGEVALREKKQINIRTATVVCTMSSDLLYLNREDYNHILREYQNFLKNEKINFLHNITIFQHWTNAHVINLEYSMKEDIYLKHQVIYKEGDMSDYLYFIEKGQVELSFLSPVHQILLREDELVEDRKGFHNLSEFVAERSKKWKRERIKVVQFQTGQFFGEKEILEKTERVTKIICISPHLKMYRIHRSEIPIYILDKKSLHVIYQKKKLMTKLMAERLEVIKMEIRRQNESEIDHKRKKHTHFTEKYRPKIPNSKETTERDEIIKEKPKIARPLMKISIRGFDTAMRTQQNFKSAIFQTGIEQQQQTMYDTQKLLQKLNFRKKSVIKNPTLIDKGIMEDALQEQLVNKHFSSKVHPLQEKEVRKLEQFHSKEPNQFVRKQLKSIRKWQKQRYPMPNQTHIEPFFQNISKQRVQIKKMQAKYDDALVNGKILPKQPIFLPKSCQQESFISQSKSMSLRGIGNPVYDIPNINSRYFNALGLSQIFSVRGKQQQKSQEPKIRTKVPYSRHFSKQIHRKQKKFGKFLKTIHKRSEKAKKTGTYKLNLTQSQQRIEERQVSEKKRRQREELLEMSKHIKFLDSKGMQDQKDQDQYYYIPKSFINDIEKESRARLQQLAREKNKSPKKLVYSSQKQK